jgi:hypothetical protein
MDLEAAITAYSMSNARFTQLENENRFRLEVKGLAENRPSIAYGDKIVALDPDNLQLYIGRFILIEKESIVVEFNEHFDASKTYEVEFKINAKHFYNCMRAVDIIEDHIGLNALFPDDKILAKWRSQDHSPIVDAKLQDNQLIINGENQEWYNKDKVNLPQMEAVVNALRYECRPNPMIFHGPPGKNKMITFHMQIL